MNKIAGKTFLITFLVLFIVVQIYFLSEYAFAVTVTDTVVVTLNVDAGISITSPVDVNMFPNIGIAADSSIGTTTWTIKTNSIGGYTLSLKASASPALVNIASSSISFADYTEGSVGTPEPWSVGSGAKEFGYSAFGTDAPAATWGTTANSCGSLAGVPIPAQLYVSTKTTDKQIASRAVVTPSAGIVTTVCFAAQQNNVFAPSGTYTATIIATAVTT